MTLVDAVRDSRYTGERRCWPCTTVNAVVVGVVAAGFVVANRPLAAAIVAAVGAVAVWLRGYVVPFTPQFAPRLVAVVPFTPQFAPRLVAVVPGAERVFDHAAVDGGPPPGRDGDDGLAVGSGGDEAELGEGDVLDRLVEAGVVVPDGEALALDETFRETWLAGVRERRENDVETVAAAVASHLPDATVSVEGEDVGRGPYVVVSRGEGSTVDDAWLTRPVAIAEVAAVDALEAYDLDHATRVAAAGPLRLFLEECPACGGQVVETTTVECCGGTAGAGAGADAVLACEACDRRLFTLPD